MNEPLALPSGTNRWLRLSKPPPRSRPRWRPGCPALPSHATHGCDSEIPTPVHSPTPDTPAIAATLAEDLRILVIGAMSLYFEQLLRLDTVSKVRRLPGLAHGCVPLGLLALWARRAVIREPILSARVRRNDGESWGLGCCWAGEIPQGPEGSGIVA